MHLLEDHFNSIEQVLLAKSQIASNSGHSVHKGNAREDFIKEFLESHIGDTVRIGTGEIISCETQSTDKRNQFDVVLYNSSFPKINYAPTVDAFLVESVNTTIEVKSRLTKKDLKQAIIAANNIKKLPRTVERHLNPQQAIQPRIFNYLVAYGGPKNIQTVYKWLIDIEKEMNINRNPMPTDLNERQLLISESLDFIVILGVGIICFDNLAARAKIPEELIKSNPLNRRVLLPQEKNNILCLFLYLVEQVKGIETDAIQLNNYHQEIFKGYGNSIWVE